MTAPPVVYLGPSLPVSTAESILPADYRPPIKRGDLPSHYDGIVVIIDGEFGQNLSVSPKEILRLIDNGTPVIGAASMGALRAAELHPFGMAGYGWIFEAYRSGRVIADDEVAVTYSEESLTALTIPLINVRYWLECLTADGEADAITARRILARTRRVFYAERTQQRLRKEWEKTVGQPEVERLLAATNGSIADIKASDARLALAAARDIQAGACQREGKERADDNDH
jgi:TfuA protein